MNRLYHKVFERLKFYLLVLLIITSLMQLGILWNYEKQGLPFHFISQFFESEKSSETGLLSQAGDDLFVPYQAIVSEAFDKSKWLLGSTDKNSTSLWNEAKYYLSSVLRNKPDNVYPASDWGKLIDNKAFTFEFKTNIQLSLLEEFLGISGTASGGPDGIYKMIISPWDDSTDNKSNAIFILDDAKIYKYITPVHSGGPLNSKDKYEAVISDLVHSGFSNNFSFLKQSDPNNVLGFRSDLLVEIGGNKYRDYSNVESVIPDGLRTVSNDFDRIGQKVLGAERDSFDRSVDENKTIEFKTLNNIYKLSPNGFLEYNYLIKPSAEDKGGLKEAFQKSFEFIHRFGLQTNTTQLFISKIEEKYSYYEFTFDYMVNGFSVFINHPSFKDDNGEQIHHAVVIRANSKNVISCKAVLRAFSDALQSETYNIDFTDFLDSANTQDDFVKINKEVSGKDVAISYHLDSREDRIILSPVWVINAAGKYLTVPITKR